jgi:hypothetical protein
MINFEYTKKPYVDSSVVYDVYYNDINKDLALNIKGRVYVYKNVSVEEVSELIDPNNSAGTVFQSIASNHGIGIYYGKFEPENFSKVEIVDSKAKEFGIDVYYFIGENNFLSQTTGVSVSEVISDMKIDFSKHGLDIKIEKVVVHFNE